MTIQALVYRGPNHIEIQRRPVRKLRAGEVRINVASAGVCGTDVRIVKGAHSAYAGVTDRVPGHEIVGVVSEIADGTATAARVRVGDTVFVAPNIGCGECRFCRGGNENLCTRTEALGITIDGGFAHQVVIPAAAVEHGNLIRLSAELSPDTATLLEPLACVVRGQDKAMVAGRERVMVAGCGPIGLLHIVLARARGAELIIASDRSATRRAAAERAGADVSVDWGTADPERVVAEMTDHAGADVVIAAAPSPALQATALKIAAPQGRVLLFAGLPKAQSGVELDTNLIHYKELLVTGTTASTLSDCRQAVTVMEQQLPNLDWLVTEVFALDQARQAIDRAQDRSALKVVIRPEAGEAP
jgi:L-iditol 2-dehydrogenase